MPAPLEIRVSVFTITSSKNIPRTFCSSKWQYLLLAHVCVFMEFSMHLCASIEQEKTQGTVDCLLAFLLMFYWRLSCRSPFLLQKARGNLLHNRASHAFLYFSRLVSASLCFSPCGFFMFLSLVIHRCCFCLCCYCYSCFSGGHGLR